MLPRTEETILKIERTCDSRGYRPSRDVVEIPECGDPATVRYSWDGGRTWGFRCDRHGRGDLATNLLVEDLPKVQA